MPTSEDDPKDHSTSLFYRDKNGICRDDGLHEEHPQDAKRFATHAVEHAIACGWSRSDAEKEFGNQAPKATSP